MGRRGSGCPELAAMFSTWTSGQKRAFYIFATLWIAAVAFVALRGLL